MKKPFKQQLAALVLISAIVGGVSVYSFAMTAGDFVIPANSINAGGTSEASAANKILTVTGQGSPTGISETTAGATLYRMAMGYIYTLVGQDELITNPTTLEIERDATNNLNVKIKWQCDREVDIYAQTPDTDEYYDYDGIWEKVHTSSGSEKEWTDTGTDMQRYYRVASKNSDKFALAPSGSIEAVGKFVLDTPSTVVDPSRLWMSTPMESTNTSITHEVGNQATDGDVMAVFDGLSSYSSFAYYMGGDWYDYSGELSSMQVLLGWSYAYYTEQPKNICFVGKVHDGDYVSTIEGLFASDPSKVSWIARAFPSAPVDVNSANLIGFSVGYSPEEAGTLAQFDNLSNMPSYAVMSSPDIWEVWIGEPFMMEPGRGYYISEPIKTSVTWVQKP